MNWHSGYVDAAQVTPERCLAAVRQAGEVALYGVSNTDDGGIVGKLSDSKVSRADAHAGHRFVDRGAHVVVLSPDVKADSSAKKTSVSLFNTETNKVTSRYDIEGRAAMTVSLWKQFDAKTSLAQDGSQLRLRGADTEGYLFESIIDTRTGRSEQPKLNFAGAAQVDVSQRGFSSYITQHIEPFSRTDGFIVVADDGVARYFDRVKDVSKASHNLNTVMQTGGKVTHASTRGDDKFVAFTSDACIHLQRVFADNDVSHGSVLGHTKVERITKESGDTVLDAVELQLTKEQVASFEKAYECKLDDCVWQLAKFTHVTEDEGHVEAIMAYLVPPDADAIAVKFRSRDLFKGEGARENLNHVDGVNACGRFATPLSKPSPSPLKGRQANDPELWVDHALVGQNMRTLTDVRSLADCISTLRFSGE